MLKPLQFNKIRMKFSIKNQLFILLFFLTLLTAFKFPIFFGNPDFLWKVVSEECVPNLRSNGLLDPCEEVTFEKNGLNGYAIFKDRNGPLQFLLLPTTKITGIESPLILNVNSPNYFFKAWQAKAHMEKLYQSSIPDDDISLAINSKTSRSQNQLHLHISCISIDVKMLLKEYLPSLRNSWTLFPGGILGHHYFARKLTIDQLRNQNMFQLLAYELPKAKLNMAEFGLALVASKNVKNELEYILLANQADLLKMEYGHIEEIQDHECPQLYKK